MRTLVLYAHPVETSYQAALHRVVVETLGARGHEVDDCDLYGEGFDPRLSRAERSAYHDPAPDRTAAQPYIDRLRAAEALVLVFPVWNMGYPAILKGFFDRIFLPGVSFRLERGRVVSLLGNIRQSAAVTTYGATRLGAWLAGDPARKSVTRVLRAQTLGAPQRYLAHYDMNRSTDAIRGRFLNRVRRAMERFG